MSLNYQTVSVEKPETYYQRSEKAKVLLIEDDRTTRRMVRAEIGEHCDLLMAENAGLGANLFRTECPDLAFIDIRLPDGSGHALLQWMLQFNPDTFGVMFSGYSDTNNVWQSIETGAKGFIAKPFDAEKMLFFIKQCTGA